MKRFTLIELLAVVVVISALASILMPVISQSRKQALQAGCLSNLKQISILELLYARDNRSLFTPTSPAYRTPSSAFDLWTNWTTWDDYLGVFYDGRNLVPSQINDQTGGVSYPTPTKTSWIYNCPLDTRSHDGLVARSYCINVEISLCSFGGGSKVVSLNKIPKPGTTILFAERIAYAGPVANNGPQGEVIGNDECAGFSNNSNPSPSNNTTWGPTNCSANARQWISNHPRSGDLPWLFVDGHVELKNPNYFNSFLVQ